MNIDVIHVPFALGSHRRGSDLGPMAITYAGLAEQLKKKEINISEKNVAVMNSLKGEKNLKNIEGVINTSELVAKEVEETINNNRFPLILGGDHSISIGTIAGIAKKYDNLGVIWIDAHGDVNTDKTTPSGNIHGMPLAANLGYGDARLTSIYGFSPKIKPENVVILGVRDLDDGEIVFLKEQGISYYPMDEVKKAGLPTVMKEIQKKFEKNKINGLHVSFDLDVMDEKFAPGVGTPVAIGFTLQESRYVMKQMKNWKNIVSCEFVEVNPIFDNKNQTAKLTVELIDLLL